MALAASYPYYLANHAEAPNQDLEVFRGARLVVGPHGAALTNILWCFLVGRRTTESLGRRCVVLQDFALVAVWVADECGGQPAPIRQTLCVPRIRDRYGALFANGSPPFRPFRGTSLR